MVYPELEDISCPLRFLIKPLLTRKLPQRPAKHARSVRSGRITAHYSAPDLLNLIEAANRVVLVGGGHKKNTMLMIRPKRPLLAVAK